MAWDVVSMGDGEVLPAVDIRQLQLNFEAIADQSSGSPVITFPNSDLVANAGILTSGVASLDFGHFVSGARLPGVGFPAFHYYLSADALNIGTAQTPVLLNTVELDMGSGFSANSNGFTCQNCFQEGTYFVIGSPSFQGFADNDRVFISLLQNGTLKFTGRAMLSAGVSPREKPSIPGIMIVNSGDLISFNVTALSNANTDLDGGVLNTTLIGAKISGPN